MEVAWHCLESCECYGGTNQRAGERLDDDTPLFCNHSGSWTMTSIRLSCLMAYGVTCVGALVLFTSCEEDVADSSVILGTRLTTGLWLWPPIEWSTDGTKIYATTGTRQEWGDLLEIDIDTKSVKHLAGPEVQHTIVSMDTGIAYIQGWPAKNLHMLSGDRDTVLASDADWVMKTSDGKHLVYGFSSSSSSTDSVGVIETATMGTRQFDAPSWWWGGFDVPTSSPDGSEIIFYRGRSLPPAILSIASGTWRTITFPNTWAYGYLFGWTDSGALVIAGGGLMDLFTGNRISDLPWYNEGVYEKRVSGFVETTATVAGAWNEICLTSSNTNYCGQFRYRLTFQNLNSGRDQMVAKVTMDPNVSRENTTTTPYANGAFSPDARTIAFVVEGDLYVSTVPEGW